jgi:diguanylate cyclase (GGDEF)-like protein
MVDALRNPVECRADAIHPESDDSSLAAYGKLIKMLFPRAQSMAMYGVGGVPLWVAGGQDDPDMQGLAVELFTGPAGEPNCIDGTTRDFSGAAAYGFVLRDGQGLPFAVVVVVARQSSEPPSIALVLELLRPVLDCLRRDRALTASVAEMTRDLAARDGDLEMLLGESAQHVGASRDVEELGHLLQVAVDHLDCNLGTLIIPERSIEIVRRHRDHQRGNDADIVARTHRHLLAWAKLQGRTMIVNKVAATKEAPQLKILSVAVRHLSERVVGFLAFFNRVDAPDFALRQARLAELLSRKVTSIFLTAYDAATGLLACNSFEQRVNALLAASPGLSSGSIVYFDIDRLHVINEHSGMHVGDEVIARVADVIRRRAPRGALCARISGDRFAVFIADAEVSAAASAAEQIRKEVIELSERGKQSGVRVTVSAGVALLSSNARLPLSQAP